MMKPKNTRRQYDAEFKAQVLQMVANGQPATQVAQALGISQHLIYKWKKIRRADSLDKREKNHSQLMTENEQLREKIRQMELEQAVLKKAYSPCSTGIRWPFSAVRFKPSVYSYPIAY